MKKFIIWFSENKNPPDENCVFSLDCIKGVVVDANTIEYATRIAVEMEKSSIAISNTSGKCRMISRIEEINK